MFDMFSSRWFLFLFESEDSVSTTTFSNFGEGGGGDGNLAEKQAHRGYCKVLEKLLSPFLLCLLHDLNNKEQNLIN